MSDKSPLVPVSTGRVELIRELGAFTVTLMEHARHVRLATHRHREAIVGLLLRGRYDENIEGRTVEPARASLLVKPPETPHANRIGREGTDTILIQILPDRLPEDFAPLLCRPGIHLDSRFAALGEELRTELRLHGPDVAIEALTMELFSVAHRRGSRPGQGHSRRKRWVLQVRDRLHAEGSSASLAELAAGSDVDRAHLARTFRAVFGCTIGEYLRALRVERGADRLRQPNCTVSGVAADLGYFDQAHFTHEFKAAYGVSPGAWRRAATQRIGDD